MVGDPVARLNLLVELFAECADMRDRDAVLRIVGDRIRWLLEFDDCTLRLTGDQGGLFRAGASGFSETEPSEVPEAHLDLLEHASERGTPISDTVPASTLAVPLLEDGRPFGAICIGDRERRYGYRDITILQRVAQHLAATLSRLDYRRVAEESRRKDEFIARLAHELRNPLAPILTAAELLRMRGDDSPELGVIERQTRHLRRLVDDLLDVSRLSADQVSLQREPIEIHRALALALEIARPLIDAAEHELTVDCASSGLTIHADPARIAQILSNLLTNAARYTEPRGTIHVAARREGPEVVVDVVDDGAGIALEEQPRLFEAFHRGAAAARSTGGLGLGLSLAASLAGAHGGRVSAASEGLGRGSTFTLRLPALDEVIEPQEQDAQAPSHGSGRRIMVVDDNEDAASLLSMMLTLVGHTVSVAHDGAAALRLAEDCDPELAFLDIGMPEMDGYELARRLRARSAAPYLIALTGYDRAADRERAREAGFDAHLVKPVDADDVHAAITTAESSRPRSGG